MGIASIVTSVIIAGIAYLTRHVYSPLLSWTLVIIGFIALGLGIAEIIYKVKSRGGTLAWGIVGIVLSVPAITYAIYVLVVCSIIDSAYNMTTIDIGTDYVTSVGGIIGKRKVVGVNKQKTENGEIIQEFCYNKITDTKNDLLIYVNYLRNNEKFVVTKWFDLNDEYGILQLGKLSSEKGNIILLDIEWSPDSYFIRLTKHPGDLNGLS
ncbi:MAG: hypothetical protein RSD14_00175 [Clostridia bacterium]